jgi:hypothetical protein
MGFGADHGKDEHELFWWRAVFSCRFPSGNLPPVGTALLGSRFRLMVEDMDGELREWTRDD